ncbi:glycerophosphodiester phosphodiesterase [Chitinophagaceae bacterium IBVUCB2]|nr:glycerophosphodiester phosphodiesterase [Chitinophagaceae bacterium IBVUCB2]
MKNLFLATYIIILSSCTTSQKSTSVVKFADNPVIAHRGAWKKNKLPENSIASLKEAIRLGCTGSEFDIWMTADDSIVINHDPHYNKLTIEKTNYADLLAFKLSNGEKIPTLREYLLAGLEDNNQTMLVLEIKPSTISVDRGRIVATRVVQLVKELNATAMSAYISFDYEILKRIIEIDPKASTQYLKGDVEPTQLKKDKMTGLDYHFSVFKKQPTWADEAKKEKLILNAWTVNDAAEMNLLLDKGFHYITTNEPELLFDIVRNRSKK